MRVALAMVTMVLLASVVMAAPQVKIGDPILNLLTGLHQVDTLPESADACGPQYTNMTVLKEAWALPQYNDSEHSSAMTFRVMGEAYPFAVAIFDPNAQGPIAVYFAFNHTGTVTDIYTGDNIVNAPNPCEAMGKQLGR